MRAARRGEAHPGDFRRVGQQAPLDELARAFESQRGVGVEITYGGSGTVLSQMMLARTGDLYIPGSQDFMDTAEAKGAVDPSTRKIVAYLVPAIAVPKGNPKNILTLAGPGAARPARRHRQPGQRLPGPLRHGDLRQGQADR